MIFLRRLLNNDGPMPLSVGFEVFEALRKGPVKHIFTEIGKFIPRPLQMAALVRLAFCFGLEASYMGE